MDSKISAAMMRLAAVMTLIMVSQGAATAGGEDGVWQRTQADGAVSLTNVPDGNNYELLVSGPKAGGASAPAPSGGLTAPAVRTDAAMSGAAIAQHPVPAPLEGQSAQRQDSTPPVLADDPEVARMKATTAAGQAVQEISAAGGHAERLQALYQASRAAVDAQRRSDRSR